MRKTKSGDLLVELTKSNTSITAAGEIRKAITASSPENKVVCLGHNTEIEIVDLDAITTKEEVLSALISASDIGASEETIKVTGIWATKSGHQIATAVVPANLAGEITCLKIGLTLCRVRPRKPAPTRCYRCHGFGHSTIQFSGPELSYTCRRCNAEGHKEKDCTAGHDRCVLCERGGFPKTTHRPGTGKCTAWQEAHKANNEPDQ